MNPTRGIDLGAHADIIWAIEALCADGIELLVISSELEEMAGYADRIIVLRDRRHADSDGSVYAMWTVLPPWPVLSLPASGGGC